MRVGLPTTASTSRAVPPSSPMNDQLCEPGGVRPASGCLGQPRGGHAILRGLTWPRKRRIASRGGHAQKTASHVAGIVSRGGRRKKGQTIRLPTSSLAAGHGGQPRRFIPIKLAHPGFGCKLPLLTEHRLPGVRLPPDGAFPLLLFPALQCRSRIGGPETSVNKDQKEQSYDHSHR